MGGSSKCREESEVLDLAQSSFKVSVADELDVESIIDLLTVVAAEGRWIGTELPIDRDARRRRFLTTIMQEDALVLVARMNDSIIGEATLWSQWPGLSHLGMVVETGWRSQGVGTALLAYSIAWAREKKRTRSASKCFHTIRSLSPSTKNTGSSVKVSFARIFDEETANYGTASRWAFISRRKNRSRQQGGAQSRFRDSMD